MVHRLAAAPRKPKKGVVSSPLKVENMVDRGSGPFKKKKRKRKKRKRRRRTEEGYKYLTKKKSGPSLVPDQDDLDRPRPG